ncbi:unnamed protein product [Urochloa decumbens]|uniref:DUF1618 domain-containing protein n=1 Tax=Urochloa decumbens TaxID=240449 RepID=A0ABC9D4B3_9POAL
MAPPWVLLERTVMFVSGEAVTWSPSGDLESSGGVSGGGASTEAAAIDDQEMSMQAILEAMKPDPGLSDPPGISQLHMVRRIGGGLSGGDISSTDKALVVLYAGFYRPGFSCNSLSGCYLVYDASSNSLSAIPPLPDPHTFSGLGLGTAILSLGEGRYLLAELVERNSGFPDAALFLWQCTNPNPTQGQWIRKEVRLPPQVFAPDYDFQFQIDMTFSYAGSFVCWVDLLKGVLVCNLLGSTEPELTFVPLPEGCSIDVPEDKPRPWSVDFRSMGCVNGVIKFVTVDGYYEKYRRDDLTLKSWTLSRDLKVWEAGTPLPLRDLLASESFRERELPQILPLHPVISVDEDEVVYFVLNEVDRVDAFDIYGNVSGVEIVPKARPCLVSKSKIQNECLST